MGAHFSFPPVWSGLVGEVVKGGQAGFVLSYQTLLTTHTPSTFAIRVLIYKKVATQLKDGLLSAQSFANSTQNHRWVGLPTICFVAAYSLYS